MSDWSSGSSMDKMRTYNVQTATMTTTTSTAAAAGAAAMAAAPSAAENGTKVRKKTPQKESEIVRAKDVEQIPTAPSSELFELLCRLQSSRLDDQRCSLPMAPAASGNPNSQSVSRVTPSKMVLQVQHCF